MKEIKISLDTIDKVKNFVNIAMQYPQELVVSSGRFVVNAKSIMGLFSLDLTKKVLLSIPNDVGYKVFKEKLSDVQIDFE
ncbi:MAG: HPr family phosphocarrier protein [Oscillospiraceae bacterium]|nr:HPr family phosphocarrier protein [Oscillospiraceae bacterium]